MPLFFRRRIVALGAVFDYSAWLTQHFPLADRWDHQDPVSSSVLEASYSTALALGRELSPSATRFTFTADDPDGWNVIGEVGADPEASEVGSGQAHGGAGTGACNLFSSAAASTPRIRILNFLSIGKTYRVTITVSNDSGAGTGVIKTDSFVVDNTFPVGTTSFDVVANETTLTVRVIGTAPADLTIDTVSVKQLNIAESSEFPGPEELSTSGVGTMDKGNWTVVESPPNQAVTQINSSTLKLVSDDATSVSIAQASMVTGRRYLVNYDIVSITGVLKVDTGIPTQTITVARNYNSEFTAIGTSIRFRNSGAANINIANISITEQNPMNGDTVVSEVGVPTNFGSLGLSVVDDGAASKSGFLSAELNSKLNLELGFISMWGQSDTWAAGKAYLCALIINANYQIYIARDGSNLIPTFRSNGVDEQISIASGSPSDWFHIVIKWAYPGNVAVYYQGVPSGTPQAIANQMIGNLTAALFGAASDTPTLVWDDGRTRAMLGYEDISDAQVLSLYNQGRR
ncbi:MAG TPA: hypothetical protein ENI05_00880 [Porticoccus sp.]|nr:hypothetical protein [Porticoccus sp.]